jgi:hypothetical protein
MITNIRRKLRWLGFAILTLTLAVEGRVQCATEPQRADPIPPSPQNRSLLPAPRTGVVMVRVVDGRLNVPLGGWGGQRLIQAKTDPEKFRGYVRAVKERGLNCVRPLFHPPNAAKASDANWARFDWEAMDRAVAITQEEVVYFLVEPDSRGTILDSRGQGGPRSFR